MAEISKGYGTLPDGSLFEITFDGLATSRQMDRLISSISASLGRAGIQAPGESGSSALRRAKEFKRVQEEQQKVVEENTDELRTALEQQRELNDQNRDFSKNLYKLNAVFQPLIRGNFGQALYSVEGLSTRLAIGVGAVIGGLIGYADTLTSGLQRGISGNIFDFAIAAKTAGLSIKDFSSALKDSAGGFASLGMGATDGAKQFANLIRNVRTSTAEFGNLGLNNEQLASLTAQQVKVAVTQGFKGRQAQDLVIRNTRVLAEEIDNLANRTGKSVLELTEAAAKLAQDPIVANFVRSARQGGEEISKSVQVFAANLRGIFGERGDQLAKDALQSALSGLPMVISQTGKNLALASSSIYSELERQAQNAARGETATEADRERLRNLIIKEAKSRSQELNAFALLGGAVGDSAKQILELANEAEFYNTEEGARRREQDKTAQQFNAAVRELQANVQALAIPILRLLNQVNWGTFITVISTVIDAFNTLFDYIGQGIDSFLNLIPFAEEIRGAGGKIIGGLLGIGAVIAGGIGIWNLLVFTSTKLKGSFTELERAVWNTAASLNRMANQPPRNPGMGPPAPMTAGQRAARAGAMAGIGTVAGMGLDMGANAVGRETTGGALLGTLGTTASYAANFAAIGSIIPGIGTAAGAAIGGAIGLMKGLYENKDTLFPGEAAKEIQTEQASAMDSSNSTQIAMLQEMKKMNEGLSHLTDESSYGNMIGARNTAIQSDNNRYMRDLAIRGSA
jgi:hypothetical protein